MACNVFGTPVTDETLKGMTKYHDKAITRLDKAVVAFEMKNAEGKDVSAHNFVDTQWSNYDKKDGIRCLIYNATGGLVKMVTYSDGDGSIGPSPYPTVLANGQWGAFFHPLGASLDGAHAVVYAGKSASGVEYQWTYQIAALHPGRCYTDIRPAGHYPLTDNTFKNYSVPMNNLKTYIHHSQHEGCASFASIGGSNKAPFFEGIMTLEAALGW